MTINLPDVTLSPGNVTKNTFVVEDDAFKQEAGEGVDNSVFENTSSSYIDEEQANRMALWGNLAAGENGDRDTFNKVVDEAVNYGGSGTFAKITEGVHKAVEQEYMSIVKQRLDKGEYTSGEEAVEDVDIAKTTKQDVKTRALENVALQNIDATSTMDDKESVKAYLSGLDKTRQTQTAFDSIFNKRASELENGFTQISTDIGGMMLPLTSTKWGLVVKDVLGEASWSDYALTGNVWKTLSDYIKSRPLEEQPEALNKVLDSMRQRAGLIGASDMQLAFSMMSLESYLKHKGARPDTDWETYLENAGGVLDFIGAGILSYGGAKGATLALRKWFSVHKAAKEAGRIVENTPLKELQQANPALAAKIAAAAVADKSGKIAKAAGVTREEILKDVLPQPKIPEAHTQGLPAETLENIRKLEGKAEEILDIPENIALFYDASWSHKLGWMDKVLRQQEKTFKYQAGSFTIERDMNKNIINYEAVYGKDGTTGFRSIKQAEESIEDFTKKLGKKDVGEKGFKILVKPEDSTTFSELEKGKRYPKGTEFFVKFNGSYRMKYTDIVKPPGAMINPVSSTTRYLPSPRSVFDPIITQAANTANERGYFLKNRLYQLSRPFQKLHYKGKQRVANLLEDGDKNEIDLFTWEQARERGLSENEYHGYLSARIFWRTVHKLEDDVARRDLLQEGFNRTIKVKSKGGVTYENIARPLEAGKAPPANVKSIFDVNTGKVVEVTEKAIADAYKHGRTIVQFKTKLDSGNKLFYYGIVKLDDLSDLPDNVLHTRPGYIRRNNVEPWFVDYYPGNIEVNGVLSPGYRRTIGTATSRAEAHRYRDALRTEEYYKLTTEQGMKPEKAKKIVDEMFKERLDRNIESVMAKMSDIEDQLNAEGGYWFNKRGSRLKKADGTEGRVADPLETIEQASSQVASLVTHRELFESMDANLKKMAPAKAYNEMGQYIGHTIPDAGDDALKRANAYYRYIQGLKEVKTEPDAIWTRLMVGMDEWISKLGDIPSKVGGKVFLETLVRSTPSKIATGATFYLKLGTMPFRQFNLNAATALRLNGIDPLLVAPAYRESTAIVFSLGLRDTKHWAKERYTLAKMAGLSEEEFEEVVDAFRLSGKQYTADANVVVNELSLGFSRHVSKSLAEYAARGVGTAAKSPLLVLKAMGFDAGELMAQISNWSFARRLHIKNNPSVGWNSSEMVRQRIANQARAYAIDMTKVDRMPYQRGWFSAATQFWAINHKALLDLAPYKGSKYLNGVRGRYALGMVAMYGLEGAGVYYLWGDAIKERLLQAGVHPKAVEAATTGIFQFTANSVMDLAAGASWGTNKTAWSGSFSPASGISQWLHDVTIGLATGDKTVLEAIAGASSSVPEDLVRAAKAFRKSWAYGETKENDTITKFVNGSKAFISSFGIFSTVARYNAAITLMERGEKLAYLNPDYKPMVEATKAELLVAMSTGAKPMALMYLYSLRAEHFNNHKNLKKDAKDLATQWMKLYIEIDDPLEREDKLNALIYTMSPEDTAYGLMLKEQARFYVGNMEGDTEKFVAKVLSEYCIFNPECSKASLEGKIRGMDFLNDEQKETALAGVQSVIDEVKDTTESLKQNEFFTK